MSSTGSNLKIPPRVLVVDDNPNFVDFLTQVLSRRGIDILTAYNGQQCLEQVHQSSALDVIILDIIMPEMDGLEVCAALQQMGPAHFIPIIVLTARDNMDTRLAAMRLGVSEFLVKPVRIEELVSRIRSQVEAVSKIRAAEQSVANLKVKPKKTK